MGNLLVLKSKNNSKISQPKNNRQQLAMSSFQKLLPLALGILSISFASPVWAQERMLRTLIVNGRGVETIPTTITRVELGVEVQGKNANEVQQELARRSSAVVDALRSSNVERIQTTGIRLNPVYEYLNNRQELKGYSGVNTVSFRVAPNRAGQVIDVAVQAGATMINGVSFMATDAAIDQAQQQALRLATQDAQRQADTVLSALNLTRREIVNIQINGATQPPMLLQNAVNTREAFGASTPVLPGDQKVEAGVTLTISY